MSPLDHSASSRTVKTALILIGVWLAVLALWLTIDLAHWVAALLLAPTLPAAWDFASARTACLRLDDRMLEWRSGRATGQVALVRLDRVRFETRLDLTVRVRLVLDSGKRLSIPQDCLPPWPTLQQALEARGLRTERHHFSLLS